jgi:hypothetical protein
VTNWFLLLQPRFQDVKIYEGEKAVLINVTKLLDACLIVFSGTSKFSAIWRLSPLLVTGLQI